MSDDFVDISNTSPNSETLTKEEIENNENAKNENDKNENVENAKNENNENNENVENAKNENVDQNKKNDDKSSLENEIFPHKVFNKIFNSSEEIKENDNIISLLLNGFLKNLMKNKASLSDEEEEDDEDEEDADDDEDVDEEDEENDKVEDDVEDEEDDVEDEEDEDDYPEIFIIVENKKTFNYDTSYAGASRTMTARFHNFLEQNSTRYLRIDKNEEYITIYERHPNTFAPYEEHLIYHIEFFTVEKYKDQ
jgi:hypothetical protein